MKSEKIVFSLLYVTSLWCPAKIFASTMVAIQNQESVLSINEELGSVVQLPSAVSTVTSSKYFYINDIGSVVDPTNGMKVDVRTFQIKPVDNARKESVTFVLADGKNISFKFIPTKNADKFYDVRLEPIKSRSKLFMSQEMDMLKHMILDDAGDYARRLLAVQVKSDFKKLKFKLIRMYQSSEFTGYVFQIENLASKTQTIDLSGLAFGVPNKAVLSHVDQDLLAACPLMSVTTDCVTRLHLVIRGTPNSTDDFKSSLSSIHSVPPFVKTNRGEL